MKTTSPKRFKRIYVEISNHCNIQCSFCPLVERPKKFMSLEDFRRVLNQVIPLTQEICLHLMGEPLVHPQLKSFLREVSLCEGKVQLTTNGLLIKKYTELLLAETCMRQVNFSLQSFRDNFPHASLENYLTPIVHFIRRAFEYRPDLYINLRLWNYENDSFEKDKPMNEFIAFFEKELDFHFSRKKVDVASVKGRKVLPEKRLYFHFDSRFDWPSFDLPKRSKRGTCHGLRNHIGIHGDGRVVPCCLDKEGNMALGNIFNDDLIRILNSKRALAMKKGFQRGELVEDLCQRCTFIKRFDSKKRRFL